MSIKQAEEKAHKHSSKHREELNQSEECGCFNCISIYPPTEIKHWIDNGQTALCPHCDIDSVIGSKSGYPITEDFLKKMYTLWF